MENLVTLLMKSVSTHLTNNTEKESGIITGAICVGDLGLEPLLYFAKKAPFCHFADLDLGRTGREVQERGRVGGDYLKMWWSENT